MAKTQYWTQKDLDAYLREHCHPNVEYTSNELLEIALKAGAIKFKPGVIMERVIVRAILNKGWEQIDRIDEISAEAHHKYDLATLFYKYQD
jgi:hypothetical protein